MYWQVYVVPHWVTFAETIRPRCTTTATVIGPCGPHPCALKVPSLYLAAAGDLAGAAAAALDAVAEPAGPDAAAGCVVEEVAGDGFAADDDAPGAGEGPADGVAAEDEDPGAAMPPVVEAPAPFAWAPAIEPAKAESDAAACLAAVSVRP